MSLDVSIQLYFPIAEAAAAMAALRKVLRKRKFVLGILVATPDGQTTRIPATPLAWEKVRLWKGGEEEEDVKVPTISQGFPDVVGTEPVFLLDEPMSLSGMTVEFVVRRAGEVVASLETFFSLSRGSEYLGLAFSNRNSGDVDEFFSDWFRSRIATILHEGEGVAAAYCGMGVWSWFDDQSPFEVPESEEDEGGTDSFAKFLVEKRGEDV